MQCCVAETPPQILQGGGRGVNYTTVATGLRNNKKKIKTRLESNEGILWLSAIKGCLPLFSGWSGASIRAGHFCDLGSAKQCIFSKVIDAHGVYTGVRKWYLSPNFLWSHNYHDFHISSVTSACKASIVCFCIKKCSIFHLIFPVFLWK